MHIVYVIYNVEDKEAHKGAYPRGHTIFKLLHKLYTCWVNRHQLLGDIVLVISEIFNHYIRLDL